jgi:hypothetical protein
MARIVIARMAGLSPGTSPPPVNIPMTPFFLFTCAIIVLPKDLALQKIDVDSVTCCHHNNGEENKKGVQQGKGEGGNKEMRNKN